MNDLDASVFQHYTDFLARRATGMIVRWTVAGLAVGGGLGAVMLTSWANWPVQHRQAYLVMALGAVACGLLGRRFASRRALGLELQARLAQHQLQFERTALAVGSAAAAPAQSFPVAAPAQVPALESVPAPPAPPAVAPAPPFVPAGAPPVSSVEPAPVPEPAPAPAPTPQPAAVAAPFLSQVPAAVPGVAPAPAPAPAPVPAVQAMAPPVMPAVSALPVVPASVVEPAAPAPVPAPVPAPPVVSAVPPLPVTPPASVDFAAASEPDAYGWPRPAAHEQ